MFDNPETAWPATIFVLGVLALAVFLIIVVVSSLHEFRKLKVETAQRDELRQLVRRYEQLAESTLDAQQRTSVDVSELRTRTAAIEQMLRSVE